MAEHNSPNAFTDMLREQARHLAEVAINSPERMMQEGWTRLNALLSIFYGHWDHAHRPPPPDPIDFAQPTHGERRH